MTAILDERPASGDNPAPQGRRGHFRIPGETGIWVFILADLMIFGCLFVAYLDRRIEEPELFTASQDQLNQNFGAINTVVLLVSSLFVVLAVQSMKSQRLFHLAPRFIAAAFGCGVIFLVIKAFEYAEKVDHDITTGTNEFFMYYFTLTGVHGFHVVVGLFALTIMYRIARKPVITTKEFTFFESGACFWHMVDLLWIVLFPLLFLVR